MFFCRVQQKCLQACHSTFFFFSPLTNDDLCSQHIFTVWHGYSHFGNALFANLLNCSCKYLCACFPISLICWQKKQLWRHNLLANTFVLNINMLIGCNKSVLAICNTHAYRSTCGQKKKSLPFKILAEVILTHRVFSHNTMNFFLLSKDQNFKT